MRFFTRFYWALCLVALAGFAWAEYHGYVLTGSDEAARGSSHSSSRLHHK